MPRFLLPRMWVVLAGLALILAGSNKAYIPTSVAVAAPVPAGLTATEWQEIQSQLPHAPAAVNFTQEAYLKASNNEAEDYFGHSVAVSGDTVVVGSIYEDSGATGVNGDQTSNTVILAGAAFVFIRDENGEWTQQAYLKASNTGKFDEFGTSVAISGDTIVVGASGEDSGATGVNGDQTDNSESVSGAAYVFVRNGTTWSQQAYLKASNTYAEIKFGLAVAVDNDTIVVGARYEDSGADGVNGNPYNCCALDAGAAYVFVRNDTTWSQQAYLKASNSDLEDGFGASVAVSGETIVVGAPGEDSNATGVNGDQTDNSASVAGAAYVFVRNGTTWSQQSYLKGSNTNQSDAFGGSVAVSGETIVVGAPNEDSSATGINGNGNQTDNSSGNSGAAYVFVRTGSTWNQQAYVKASNTDAGDFFGQSVAVDADTIVVGAFGEASNATGVNGNQQDNSMDMAGSMYVFERSGSTWSQQAYLKSSNTDQDDWFGENVAVSGDTIVTGAMFEDSDTTGINSTPNNNGNAAGAAYIFTRTNTYLVSIPLLMR